MGGPTREAATNVFLSELPSIAERGAILILDDFHLVDESPDVRQITRELVARAPERLSIVFASRHAPTIPLARLRTAGEVAEIGTDDLRFDASRDRPPVHRDVRTRPRTGRHRRRRRADRGLGGVAAAGPGGAARSVARRDPPLRPWPDRCRPGAVRLPRGGGRRRPARRPPAVPDADLDPPGRHAGPCRRRHGAGRGRRGPPHRGGRATDAAQPATALVARPAALPPAGARVPRGAACDRRSAAPPWPSSTTASPKPPPTSTGASPPTTTARPATLRRSRPWSSAAIPDIMSSAAYAAASEFIDGTPAELRPAGVWGR